MAIAIVSTGGTIASTAGSDGAVSPELVSADLVESVPGLESAAAIETHDFSNVPSPHFTVEQMAELVSFLEDLDSRSGIDGIVVTHGTDILEETAYFADLTYSGNGPVVFTGAMRNPSLASPDGPANLLASVRTAASEEARDRGVLVVFNDRVHDPRTVTKMHSMNPDTFRSPEFGPIAVHDEDRIDWRIHGAEPREVFDIDADELTNRVASRTVTADMHPSFIPDSEETAALCLAATGAGHIPPTIIPPLEELAAAGTPLVATTRCPEGRLARETYDFVGSEATLQELEFSYSDLNLQKTRIKTVVALAAGAIDTAFD